MSEVAARMGWVSAFSYDTPADIWREHARLTAYQNEGARVLNLSAQATLTNRAYEAMEPFVWGGQPFADGRFSTPMAAPASCLCARWQGPCPTGR
jgi:assimilatory nitrate reductase catalytic subunit